MAFTGSETLLAFPALDVFRRLIGFHKDFQRFGAHLLGAFRVGCHLRNRGQGVGLTPRPGLRLGRGYGSVVTVPLF